MFLKKFFLFSGACVVLGTYLIQALPPSREEEKVSSRPPNPETPKERRARVRKEVSEENRELAKQKQARKSRPISSAGSDLSVPLLSSRSDSSLSSDDARKVDEIKFNEGITRVQAFHANQEQDARLTSEYLQKQLDLEGVEKFERDDLVANFHKNIAGMDSRLSRFSPEERDKVNTFLAETLKTITPEEQKAVENMTTEERQELEAFIEKITITPEGQKAVENMTTEERQELEAFIEKILLKKNDVENAPYGNENEMSIAQLEAEQAKKRAELQKFIDQVVTGPTSSVVSADGIDDEGDGPVFTQEPDDNKSIIFTEEDLGDESSVSSKEPVAHMVDAAVQHEKNVISHAQSELAKIDETLKDPKSTKDDKKEVEGRAQRLLRIVASGERLLDRVETIHEAEVKSGGWYDKLVTQKNMLKALSIGLKAASLGIVGYGTYKSLSSGSGGSTGSGSSVSTVASEPVSVSRGNTLEGFTIKAPKNGGWFSEHRTIATDYRPVYKTVFDGGK